MKISEKAPIYQDWKVQKVKLKEMFDELSDEDLEFSEGEQDAMFNKIQMKLNITKEELYKIITTV
ncbi:MAG: hypothetical protein ACK4NY_21710 [Spirosomataceae bacterium]